jgi:CHAD domain-containing protein
MADGKWINDLSADTSPEAAARQVLFVRLRVVRDCLSPAVHEADRDPEHVHQLRVATRRADAALRIFRSYLPDKGCKAARRRLRAVRRAAGDARDWDVFLLDLGQRGQRRPAGERPGLDLLTGYAFGQRAAAQSVLEAVSLTHGAGFDEFLTDTVAAVRPAREGPPTLLDLARPTLAALHQNLEAAASGDLRDYTQLHQVRIAGKRLRYAMEVFADCFPAPFREEIYPLVEEMQDVLGRANDSHVAAGWLAVLRERLQQNGTGTWKRAAAGVESLLRYHQQRLPKERRNFLRWWDCWQKTASGALLNYLLPPAVG